MFRNLWKISETHRHIQSSVFAMIRQSSNCQLFRSYSSHAYYPGSGNEFIPNAVNPTTDTPQKPQLTLDMIAAQLSSDHFDPHEFPNCKDSIPFSLLAKTLDQISNSKGKDSKNLQKLIFSNFFRLLIVYRPEDLYKAVYLSIGQIYPEYKQIELGIGKETLYSISQKYTGKSKKDLKSLETLYGDLGDTIEKIKSDTQSLAKPQLSIGQVYDCLCEIAGMRGTNSKSLKESNALHLLSQATATEAKYLIRIMQQSLKIGASNITVLNSLARAACITPPRQQYPHLNFQCSPSLIEQLEKSIQDIISVCPDYGRIVSALLCVSPGLDPSTVFEECKMTPGTPVKPMTAQPTKQIKDIISRFSELKITCEYKYDGIRGQIHVLENRDIEIYSRGSENLTSMYPDIVDLMKNSVNFERIKNCIIDCEIVAFDPFTNTVKGFSEIQHRRKGNILLQDVKISICVFVFDLLYLNDAVLIASPLQARRAIFTDNFRMVPGRIEFVQYKDIVDTEEIEGFLESSVEKGCEGLMIKSLGSLYEPGQRSFAWLKLKKDYLTNDAGESLGDSLDLVPIGAYFGNGRRTGIYGSFLLAIYDPVNDQYQTICKTGTGFTDADLQGMYGRMKKNERQAPLDNFKSNVTPDVWLLPEDVWEIKCSDLTVSSVHTGAWSKIVENKGISLRFPRFLRKRDDKKPEDSTSPLQIEQMYRDQVKVVNNS